MAKRRYRVVGPHVVMGHEPGEEFTADLSDFQERFFVDAGHLAPVKDKPKKEEEQNDG